MLVRRISQLLYMPTVYVFIRIVIHRITSYNVCYTKLLRNVFPRGTAPIRKVFELLKSIRLWNAQDRIYETKAIEYWKEELEFTGKDIVTFEIELFCRNNEDKRTKSISEVTYAISALGGHVLKICYIEEISYHSLLVNLPRAEIQQLVDNYSYNFV